MVLIGFFGGFSLVDSKDSLEDSLVDSNRILWWILIGFSEGLVPVAPIQGKAQLANALG